MLALLLAALQLVAQLGHIGLGVGQGQISQAGWPCIVALQAGIEARSEQPVVDGIEPRRAFRGGRRPYRGVCTREG